MCEAVFLTPFNSTSHYPNCKYIWTLKLNFAFYLLLLNSIKSNMSGIHEDEKKARLNICCVFIRQKNICLCRLILTFKSFKVKKKSAKIVESRRKRKHYHWWRCPSISPSHHHTNEDFPKLHWSMDQSPFQPLYSCRKPEDPNWITVESLGGPEEASQPG